MSSWYLSGVLVFIVVVLISVYAIVFDGVFFFIAALFSSGITLLVSYGGGGGYDGLLIVLGIKPDAYNLGNYNSDIYSLPAWFIAINLLN